MPEGGGRGDGVKEARLLCQGQVRRGGKPDLPLH